MAAPRGSKKPQRAAAAPARSVSVATPSQHGKAAASPQLRKRLRPVVQVILGICLTYTLFRWALPALADLTPPGVDMEQVRVAIEEEAQAAHSGCPDACKGMSCPAGWTTGRDANDACKCVCKRINPQKLTAWDAERQDGSASQHGAAAQHGVAVQHGAAAHEASAGKAPHGTAQHAAAQHGAAVQHGVAAHEASAGKVPLGTAQHAEAPAEQARGDAAAHAEALPDAAGASPSLVGSLGRASVEEEAPSFD